MKIVVLMGFLGLHAAPSAAQTQPFVEEGTVTACFITASTGGVSPDCLGHASGECQRLGFSSTIGIVRCIQAETEVWDKHLNQSYKALSAAFTARDAASSEGKILLNESLLAAQRAWIAFRDAECRLSYAQWQDGTIRSVFHAGCMLDFTARRAIELRDMIGN